MELIELIERIPKDGNAVAIVEEILSHFPRGESWTKHAFAGGIYMRTMFVPKWSIITSMVHLTEHFFSLMSGEIIVRAENGSVSRLAAPFAGITDPGEQRIAVTVSDVIWVTYHATDETDPSKIENSVVKKSCHTSQ